jgi:hypothetical protein
MDVLAIAREALGLAWRNKRLWVFGIFVAAASSGGAPGAPGGGSGGLPAWALALAGGAVVLGAGALWMHVLSEGALIEGVRRARGGAPVEARQGFGYGRGCFGRVLQLKLAALGAITAATLVLAAPALLAWRQVLPAPAVVTLSATIIVMAVPWLLTGYFVYAYALRFAVLDGLGAWDAVRAAWRYLPGRVLESLKLLALAFAGQLGAGIAGAVAVAPGVGLGALVFLSTGSAVAAVVAGCALALPPALAVAGALGTFRSAVWTLGFLDGREAESP